MNEILSLLKTFAQEEPNVTTDNTAVCESCGGNMNEQPAVISLSDILRLAGMDSMPHAQQPTEVPASTGACTCPHCGSAHSPVSEEQDVVDEADMEEGNQFSGELAKAKAAGDDSFEVDGEKYKVEADEGMGSAFMKAYETLLRNKQ